MTTHDKLIEFIRDWKLSQPLLAEKIGVNPNTFNNKIMAREGYKWAANEKATMYKIFCQMQEQLNRALEREVEPEVKKINKPKRTVFITTKLKPA